MQDKYWFADEARVIVEDLKLPLFATEGTAKMLNELGFQATVVGKTRDEPNSAMQCIERGDVDLVINVPRLYDEMGRPDGYQIRRSAVDAGVPLVTDLQLARAVVEALRTTRSEGMSLQAWSDYHAQSQRVLG